MPQGSPGFWVLNCTQFDVWFLQLAKNNTKAVLETNISTYMLGRIWNTWCLILYGAASHQLFTAFCSGQKKWPFIVSDAFSSASLLQPLMPPYWTHSTREEWLGGSCWVGPADVCEWRDKGKQWLSESVQDRKLCTRKQEAGRGSAVFCDPVVFFVFFAKKKNSNQTKITMLHSEAVI